MEASELKEELIKTHDYSEDLAESIALAYTEVCKYYKMTLKEYNKSDDDISSYMYIILNEVKNCNFVISDIKSNDVRSLKLRDGIFESAPILENGEVKGVKKTVTLPNSFRDDYDKSQVFFRSIMTLSRSALNPYTAYESTVDVRNGFETTSYSKTGKKLSSKGYGLEIGTKDYIMMKNGYTPSANTSTERNIVGALMDPIHLEGDIVEAGITGDMMTLNEKLSDYGNSSYNELRDKMDHIHDLEVAKRAAVTDDEKYKNIDNEINNYISKEIAPITRRLSEVLTLGQEEEIETFDRSL